ncbi:MAG: bifunctional folylpolyglutamate synthase/dihydrofolate synthase [Lachnospiraceae bacterium]|jgi:dihydrofolate synthase/folylpolyglutamate synthase
MDYRETLEYIGSTNWRGSIPGLSRISRLLELLGNPQDSLRFIHVGGTNGKGSTCAFLSSILEKAGYKVGLFTSPYIEVFNERMRVNNVNISDEELAEITTFIRPFADSLEDAPTEFELNTAIGMIFFLRNECDVVVLEVGMGGEFDATNVIKTPDLTIITTISLDHTQHLGNTIEEIAATKAGIIKPGGRVVLYRQSEEATKIISRRCAKTDARLYISEPESVELQSASIDGQVFKARGFGKMATVMLGRYQMENIAVVLKAVEVLRENGYIITDGAVARGIECVKWPGRFEVVSHEPIFILDGAHNPQGMEAMAEALRSIFPGEKLIMIIGILADKDYKSMLDAILPLAREVLAVQPNSSRALHPGKLAAFVKKAGVKAEAYDSIEEAVDAAIMKAGRICPVCAAGSLYMLGDVKKCVVNHNLSD